MLLSTLSLREQGNFWCGWVNTWNRKAIFTEVIFSMSNWHEYHFFLKEVPAMVALHLDEKREKTFLGFGESFVTLLLWVGFPLVILFLKATNNPNSTGLLYFVLLRRTYVQSCQVWNQRDQSPKTNLLLYCFHFCVSHPSGMVCGFHGNVIWQQCRAAFQELGLEAVRLKQSVRGNEEFSV